VFPVRYELGLYSSEDGILQHKKEFVIAKGILRLRINISNFIARAKRAIRIAMNRKLATNMNPGSLAQ
jgi:hypothetical protein